ncbi:hypothetical protein QBC40DRAFT_85353 [Triangularia verruculosa]|uniref:VWFA domain-containing protein n=1 Tax=Triangularia verruculosa TaxID=2587418 RepID=A0AAN6XF94_9PEZI|nr:hypothetical protein QBC40DRAFT_85353 [Triangularia verruculosa]
MIFARSSALAAGLVGLTPLTAAFGTINEPVILGQHNEHEMVTRLAFQCPSGQKSDGVCFEPRSLDQLAGYHREVMGVALPGAGFNGAVGAPDTLDPVPEGPEAHCDDADFVDIPGYPQSRKKANRNLQKCVDHLRARFKQAWVSAEMLVDERRRIRPGEVELSNPFGGDCSFAFPSLQVNVFARAKCSTLEGFGRALHGVQDFYSHSNWADETDKSQPISETNPPGLVLNGTAPFLDLRASGPIPEDQIPYNLTTGCFTIPDGIPGSGECAGRVTHHALNKDHGVIRLDGTFGEAGPGSPRSEAISRNFENAVRAAVQSSQETWAAFREHLRERYGDVAGNLMICALVRDDPIKDCRKRTAVIALDTSNRSGAAEASGLQVQIAREFKSKLSFHGLDRVEVIEFAESPKVVYPMGFPESVTFNELNNKGRTNIGNALDVAIDDIIKSQPDTYTDRGAVVLLTAGAEPENTDENRELAEYALAQVERAAKEGIRIHYACINPPRADTEKSWHECSPGHSIVPAVLKTGGTFAYINRISGAADVTPAAHFISTVMSRGLVSTDEYEPELTRIYPGVTMAALLSPEDYPSKSLFYPASPSEKINITIRDRALDGQGVGSGGGGCFSVTLRDRKLDDIKIATYTSCGTEPLVLNYEALQEVDLLVVAELGDPHHSRQEEVPGPQGVVFTLELSSNMPSKNETSTKTMSSIVSSKATLKMAEETGTRTEEFLTSETVEVFEEAQTVNGTASTTSRGSHKVDAGDGATGSVLSAQEAMETGREQMGTMGTIYVTTIAGNFSEEERDDMTDLK